MAMFVSTAATMDFRPPPFHDLKDKGVVGELCSGALTGETGVQTQLLLGLDGLVTCILLT